MKLQYDDPTTHEDLMGVDDTQVSFICHRLFVDKLIKINELKRIFIIYLFS